MAHHGDGSRRYGLHGLVGTEVSQGPTAKAPKAAAVFPRFFGGHHGAAW
ncbi:hypothetical protein ATKI12_8464 [Kitasatospora sp. Ki12]